MSTRTRGYLCLLEKTKKIRDYLIVTLFFGTMLMASETIAVENPVFFPAGKNKVSEINPVDISKLTYPEDLITLQALQGIVAKNSSSQLYLVSSVKDPYYLPTVTDQNLALWSGDQFWLNYLTESANGPHLALNKYITLSDAISLYSEYIKGYIIYTDNSYINTAASYAGQTSYVPLTQTQYNSYKPLLDSLNIKNNFTIGSSYTLDNLYAQFAPTISQTLLFELNPTTSGNMPRDYAVMNNALIAYSGNTGADLDKYIKSSPAAVFGWGSEGEEPFVNAASTHGDLVVPCDWGKNISLLSSSNTVDTPANLNPMPIITYNHNSKYITFIVSDGDNFQMWINSANDARWWGNSYRISKEYPVGWTVSPSMYYLSPDLWNYYVQTSVKNQKGNDELICGPSGIGYTYGNVASTSGFAQQLNDLNSFMGSANLSVATLFGDTSYESGWNNTSYFSKILALNNISGAFYFNYPGWPPTTSAPGSGTNVIQYFNNKPIMWANAYIDDSKTVINWNNQFNAVYVCKNLTGAINYNAGVPSETSAPGVHVMDDINQLANKAEKEGYTIVSPSQMISLLAQFRTNQKTLTLRLK